MVFLRQAMIALAATSTISFGGETVRGGLYVDFNDRHNSFGARTNQVHNIATTLFKIPKDAFESLSDIAVTEAAIANKIVSFASTVELHQDAEYHIFITSHGSKIGLCHNKHPDLSYRKIFHEIKDRVLLSKVENQLILKMYIDGCYSKRAVQEADDVFSSELGTFENSDPEKKYLMRLDLYYGSPSETKNADFWFTFAGLIRAAARDTNHQLVTPTGALTSLAERYFVNFEYHSVAITDMNQHGIWSSYRNLDHLHYQERSQLWRDILLAADSNVLDVMLDEPIHMLSKLKNKDLDLRLEIEFIKELLDSAAKEDTSDVTADAMYFLTELYRGNEATIAMYLVDRAMHFNRPEIIQYLPPRVEYFEQLIRGYDRASDAMKGALRKTVLAYHGGYKKLNQSEFVADLRSFNAQCVLPPDPEYIVATLKKMKSDHKEALKNRKVEKKSEDPLSNLNNALQTIELPGFDSIAEDVTNALPRR